MSDHVERAVDVELLSAYLDGVVTAEERAYVEAQLAASAAWREELDSLRWAVALVGQTPDVALPRSFDLPVPETRRAAALAPQPARGANVAWLYGLLRGATTLSAALFVLVLAVDFLQSSAAPMPASKATAPEVMSAMRVESPVAPQGTPAPAAASAAKAAAPPAPAVQAIPASPSPFPPGSMSGMGAGGGGPGAGGAGGAGDNEAAPQDQGAPVVRQAESAATTAAEARSAPPASADTLPTALPRPPAAPAQGDPWRALEVGLALLAVVLGVGTLLVRSQMRR